MDNVFYKTYDCDVKLEVGKGITKYCLFKVKEYNPLLQAQGTIFFNSKKKLLSCDMRDLVMCRKH